MMHILQNNILKSVIIGFFLLSLCVSPVLTGIAAAAATTAPATTAAPAEDGIQMSTKLGQIIGSMILGLASWVTWFGGSLLETIIENLVIRGSEIIGRGTSTGTAIEDIWTLIRDIANLVFIFGFIYIGLATIIKPDSASTKRMIASIIIGALLINFSLFFVRFVVDVSNYLAVEVYNTTYSGGGSISDTIANTLRITTLYNADKDVLKNVTAGGSVTFYFMGAILLIVAGFVLAAGAILLIIRFVALIFIMMFSPLLFATTVFPQTADIAGKLWRKLFDYAFFAPVYLLLLSISIYVLDRFMTVMTGSQNTDMSAAVQNGTINVLGYFVVSIMFFVFSLQVAQKFGIKGADKAVGLGKAAGLGLAFGTAGIMGRNFVGRPGNWLAEKQEAMRKSDSRWSNAGAALMRGTGINAAATTAQKAKFGSSQSRADVVKEDKDINREREKNRQVTAIDNHVASGTGRGATTQNQIDMERSISGASTEQLQALLKKHKPGTPAYNALVQNMSSSQFDSLMKLKPEDLDDGKKNALKSARANLMAAKHSINQPATPGGAATVDPGSIGKADASDLEALDFNTLLQHAGYISSKQIDDMKGLTPTAKKTLKDTRKAALIDDFKHHGGAGQIFARFTNDTERSKLPADILTDPLTVSYLDGNILGKVLDNDTLERSDRNKIKTNISTLSATHPLNHWLTTPKGINF